MKLISLSLSLLPAHVICKPPDRDTGSVHISLVIYWNVYQRIVSDGTLGSFTARLAMSVSMSMTT